MTGAWIIYAIIVGTASVYRFYLLYKNKHS